MKVVFLHPPLYPVDHKFFNQLGKHIELIVYNFGEYPRLHPEWKSRNFSDKNNNYKIRFFGKGPVGFKTQGNPSMLFYLAKDRPDVVVSVAFWIPSLYASLMKKILGFKFLIKTDATASTDEPLPKVKYMMRKLVCKNTDMFISASNLTTDYLRSLCPSVPVEKSLQTVDIEEWINEVDSLPEKTKLRDELGIPKDKVVLLGVGGFSRKKNWMAVFKQMRLLQNCFFVLVGSGDEEKTYREYIMNNGLQDRVKLVGRKEGKELIKYFKMADLFLFTTLSDRFGYVVIEALATGLPVLCSKYSGVSSLIKEDKNGYLIDPRGDFTHLINKAITNLNALQKHTVSTVRGLSLDSKAEEYKRILDRVCDA